MDIDADLDAGHIQVADRVGSTFDLTLFPDNASDFMQWFHFALRGARGRTTTMRIVNAGDATYADAFEGYRACASYDLETWFRVPTTYEDGVLTFRHRPARADTFFAYFAAYPEQRRRALVERVEAAPGIRAASLGQSLDGRDLPLFVFGDEDDADKPRIWLSARQHPGESAAEWLLEGAVARLLDEDDELTQALREQVVIYLVPCVNPDGAARGNHRTNAAGVDLNRAWKDADPERSPEVHALLARMEETGVDLFVDVHADERTPYVFTAGSEGNPDYTDRLEELEEAFCDALAEIDPDYQRQEGYDRDEPGEGDLSTASNHVGEQFDCPSLTLEMPFIDNANRPDRRRGWSPERSQRLGCSVLEAALAVADRLR